MKPGPVLRSCAVLALLACSAAQEVLAVTGTMTGGYGQFVNTSECGSASGQGTFTLSLRAGGKWRLVDESGNVLAGRFVADSSQRSLTLTLDSRSKAYMVELVRDVATDLCETKAKVTSYTTPSIKVKLSQDFRSATGVMGFTVRGKTRFGAGSAKYTGSFLRARFMRKS